MGGRAGTGGALECDVEITRGELFVRARGSCSSIFGGKSSVIVTSEDVEARSEAFALATAFACSRLALEDVRDLMAWNADEDRLGGNSSLGIGGSDLLIKVTARCSKGIFPDGKCGPGPREDGGSRPAA